MSLNAKLAAFKKETADAAARNAAYMRPASSTPARTSTPQPSASMDSSKRSHAEAFAVSDGNSDSLVKMMEFARKKLREKVGHPFAFDDIIDSLSVPNDSKDATIPRIKEALKGDKYVEWIPATSKTPDMFKYKSLHPVTNAEDLKDYLAKRTTADGIPVKELKDGWPECIDGINDLEKQGFVLVTRHKRENTPKLVYPDSPLLHIQVDQDFKDLWNKIKVPSNDYDIRVELEKAGVTPTSQVKEVVKGNGKKKERKRPNRRGGKTTNIHMTGILKEYKSR